VKQKTKRKVKSWKPKIVEVLLQRDMPRKELIQHIGANTVGAIAESLKELMDNEIISEVKCSKDKPYCKDCIEFRKDKKIGRPPKNKPKKRGVAAKCLKFNADVETLKRLLEKYPEIFENNLNNFVKSDKLIENLWKHIKKEFIPEVEPSLLNQTEKLLQHIEENLKIDASAISLLRSNTFPQMLKSSKSFFKLFVTHNAEQIINSYQLFYMYATSQGISKKSLYEMTNTPSEQIRVSEEFFWELFKHSVLSDILNDEFNEDALKLLERHIKLTLELYLHLSKISLK
jgi:hypothetical protein